MKKITISLTQTIVCAITIVLIFTVHHAKSQTFPLSENFNLTPDSTLPAGWSRAGYAMTFANVYQNEGTGNSNAARLQIHSTHVMNDSVFTPVIGTITANTLLSVSYKFIQAPADDYTQSGPYVAGNFSSNTFYLPNVFPPSFQIVVIDVSNNSKTVIMQADSTNHISNTAYISKTLNLSGFSGQNIKIAFVLNGLSEDYLSDLWLDDLNINDYTVSINKQETKKETTHVFPNPAEDKLTIQCDETVTATVYDITGRVVYKESISEPLHTVNLAKNPAGLYTVALHGVNTNKTYRIIKR